MSIVTSHVSPVTVLLISYVSLTVGKAIDKIENEKKTLEDEKKSFEEKVAELNTEIDDLKKQIEEKVETEAKLLIENAIKDGKIKADKSDVIFEQAKKDLVATKNMLDAIPTQDYKGFNNVVKHDAVDERAAWTFNDWKKNDPQGLLQMSKDDKEKYNNLFKQL